MQLLAADEQRQYHSGGTGRGLPLMLETHTRSADEPMWTFTEYYILYSISVTFNAKMTDLLMGWALKTGLDQTKLHCEGLPSAHLDLRSRQNGSSVTFKERTWI